MSQYNFIEEILFWLSRKSIIVSVLFKYNFANPCCLEHSYLFQPIKVVREVAVIAPLLTVQGSY